MKSWIFGLVAVCGALFTSAATQAGDINEIARESGIDRSKPIQLAHNGFGWNSGYRGGYGGGGYGIAPGGCYRPAPRCGYRPNFNFWYGGYNGGFGGGFGGGYGGGGCFPRW